ncbi:MAG: hypothetical protein ACYCZO_15775 [Daejeonella sp.]
MIPDQFKINTLLKVNIFGHEVDVNYAYYWPRIKEEQLKLKDEGPLVSHIEFRSDSKIISETGYRSHFFHSVLLEDTSYETVQQLVTEIGEMLAKENGYEPRSPTNQMSLF